jgi:hypothetical protein
MGIYGIGTQTYTLQINSRVLTSFEHRFEDGLAICLEKAAIAAKLYENSEIERDDNYFSDNYLKDLAELIRRT